MCQRSPDKTRIAKGNSSCNKRLLIRRATTIVHASWISAGGHTRFGDAAILSRNRLFIPPPLAHYQSRCLRCFSLCNPWSNLAPIRGGPTPPTRSQWDRIRRTLRRDQAILSGTSSEWKPLAKRYQTALRTARCVEGDISHFGRSRREVVAGDARELFGIRVEAITNDSFQGVCQSSRTE
jgi:hypothetical protein